MLTLFIPIYVLEYPASKAPFFFWKDFARDMPGWVAPCAMILPLVPLGHLVWFLWHSGLGVPSIQDGQYVLSDRGHVLRLLTEGEYFALERAEARVFSAVMLSFYFVVTMYWWFKRNPQEQSE
jgi:hypothetical protein